MALRFTHPIWELVYWKSSFPWIMFSLLLSFHMPGNYMLSIITLGSSSGGNLIKIDHNVNQKLTPSPFLLLPKAPLLSLWRLIKRVWWGGTDFYSCASEVLEKTLESPLDCKEIQPVHPKGDQSWVFIVRINAEAETPVLWPPDAKSWLIGKDPDAGKDWRREEKGTTEDEMVGWHHRLDGHGFE